MFAFSVFAKVMCLIWGVNFLAGAAVYTEERMWLFTIGAVLLGVYVMVDELGRDMY
jgi:hypothetical protein